MLFVALYWVLSEGAMVFNNVVGVPQKVDLSIKPEVLLGLPRLNTISPKQSN